MTTPEEKDLLIKDLCTRLPYGVLVLVSSSHTTDPIRKKLNANLLFGFQKSVLTIKPYLRPMSSMTEEERQEYEATCSDWYETLETYDWLNAHHFDYRIVPSTGKSMIESGLALEATEGMYKV